MYGIAGKIVMWVLAVCLLPVVLAALHTFGRHAIGRTQEGVWLWLLYGMGAYVVLHLMFHRFFVTYLFTHDPVRRLWALITGYKPASRAEGKKDTILSTVTGIKLPSRAEVKKSKKGGQPNYLVRMAPFFIPLYTIIAVITIGLLDHFEVRAIPVQATCFIVGLTYMFHIFEVCHDMHADHIDLRMGSMTFNVQLVVLVNIQVLVLILWLAIPGDVNWITFNQEFLAESKEWVTNTKETALKFLK